MISKAKAQQILHEGKAHGKKLTSQQRKFFGALASGYPEKLGRGGEAGRQLIGSGDVVSWAGHEGAYSVIGIHKGVATVKKIGHLSDPEYKGSYNADVKDLSVIQKMADGGKLDAIYRSGTAKQLWEAWSPSQKLHFITDHITESTQASQEEFSKKGYNFLPANIKQELTIHHATGIYSEGGSMATGGEIYSQSVHYNGGKLSPMKQKLSNKITKLRQAQGKCSSAKAKNAIQKKIDKLQAKLDYNPTLKEKVAAHKSAYAILVDSGISKAMYQKLWNAGVLPRLSKVDGQTRFIVKNRAELEKAYAIYSDLMGDYAKPLDKISQPA